MKEDDNVTNYKWSVLIVFEKQKTTPTEFWTKISFPKIVGKGCFFCSLYDLVTKPNIDD